VDNKPKYNSQIHHHRTIRLQGYDYSLAGLYFITICCEDKACLFGKITETGNNSPAQMVLNDARQIAEECWLNIPNHFPSAILHEYIIMPNHIHGIIELSEMVGANNHSPNDDSYDQNSPNDVMINIDNNRAKSVSPQPRSPSKTIGFVVPGFKIGVTKWFRQNTDIHTVWQRNYYDIIIRDDRAYQNISDYIINNPAKWATNKFYRTGE
jgi:REP element-mobilizing transposase RayT